MLSVSDVVVAARTPVTLDEPHLYGKVCGRICTRALSTSCVIRRR